MYRVGENAVHIGSRPLNSVENQAAVNMEALEGRNITLSLGRACHPMGIDPEWAMLMLFCPVRGRVGGIHAGVSKEQLLMQGCFIIIQAKSSQQLAFIYVSFLLAPRIGTGTETGHATSSG